MVGYEVAEIKSRIKASEERMTKADAFEKACRLGFKGDFSLEVEIDHPEYKSCDYRTGIEANIEDDKVIVAHRSKDPLDKLVLPAQNPDFRYQRHFVSHCNNHSHS